MLPDALPPGPEGVSPLLSCELVEGSSMGAKYLMYSERLRRSSNTRRTVQDRKKEKLAKKVASEKVLTFADAMPNCGIWIEDEHAIDPDEVDDTNLECME